ncbi:MAG: ATP-binding protein [Rhodocyclaceae bacterium]
MNSPATQRIINIRREYNAWVANETLEDYALRYTPRAFRKWSFLSVANTALGAVSFLALEAIGGAIVLNWGFTNAMWTIGLVTLVIFVTSLPICYYAARYAVDMDLLTRGAGFGYIGSTITSLIYASFTFIFFAIEAVIMAMALELWFGLPLAWGYLVSSLVVIPLVTHGITWISRLQAWTQPFFVILLVLPFCFILVSDPATYAAFATFGGRHGNEFDLLAIGAGCVVAFALIGQIGEQVDYLRFLPPKTPQNRVRWWTSMICAGPGWIIPGALKMLAGAFLAFVALQYMIPPDRAIQPTQMYLAGFQHVVDDPRTAIVLTCVFVIICQIKINVTNAYAGSLAWSNFFSRLTHSHPGRVVWLIFNVMISLALMLLGVYEALEHVLGFYSNVAVAWIGALVADLVVNKPLGLSPRHIEFKRAYLHNINPVGVGAMLCGSVLAIAAFSGRFGPLAQAFSPFIALSTSFMLAPLIALATRGRFYLARPHTHTWKPGENVTCVVCANRFESEDMATCPAYAGAICSLCCTLDARCLDRCKPAKGLYASLIPLLARRIPHNVAGRLARRLGQFALVLIASAAVLAAVIALMYQQEVLAMQTGSGDLALSYMRIFAVLLFIAAIAAWWLVLANESRLVAQEESERQNQLLLREIEAHERTDAKLQRAKEVADSANAAKSRYVRGISHELRTPLNTILGYAQILLRDDDLSRRRREAIATMQRSGEHLLALVDGLLNISRIEAGRLQLHRRETRFLDLLGHIEKMFRLEATRKRLRFRAEFQGSLPEVVLADESRLRQVLINLLANAVRFTERGEVILRVRYQWETALFEVTDTGCGIAPEDLDRIFLPFERATHTQPGTPGEPGTGLGLTITRLLVELAGGEITVRSTPGAGSTFTVKLHLPRVAQPRVARRPERDIRGYEGPARHILAVDDQPEQSRLLTDMLEPRGFSVTTCTDAADVAALATALRPDLILLDVAMPGIDGWTLCRQLRDDGHTQPIVMVSANTYENLPERREWAGCDDFIVKPVLERELFGCLSRRLGIAWTYAESDGKSAPGAIGPAPADPGPTLAHLPAAARNELRTLAEIGHLRALERLLETLEVAHPDLAGSLLTLREHTSALRFDAILDLLDPHAVRHAPEPASS